MKKKKVSDDEETSDKRKLKIPSEVLAMFQDEHCEFHWTHHLVQRSHYIYPKYGRIWIYKPA